MRQRNGFLETILLEMNGDQSSNVPNVPRVQAGVRCPNFDVLVIHERVHGEVTLLSSLSYSSSSSSLSSLSSPRNQPSHPCKFRNWIGWNHTGHGFRSENKRVLIIIIMINLRIFHRLDRTRRHHRLQRKYILLHSRRTHAVFQSWWLQCTMVWLLTQLLSFVASHCFEWWTHVSWSCPFISWISSDTVTTGLDQNEKSKSDENKEQSHRNPIHCWTGFLMIPHNWALVSFLYPSPAKATCHEHLLFHQL